MRWIAVPPRGYDGGTSRGGTALKLDQLSLLVTTVLAFSALAALVLTGQAGIREDMRSLQATMLAGQAELRAEMLAGQAELRKEMRAGQAELRKEMRAGQAELRAGQVQIREDLAALGARLAVVEHRTNILEARLAATEPPAPEPCEGADCPGS